MQPGNCELNKLCSTNPFYFVYKAERLHRSGFVLEGYMVRLNAIQRVQDIPESIARYCADTDHLHTAAHYRIIISTCSIAGQLYSLGLRAGHITHVFVDEVCGVTECELVQLVIIL